MTILEMLSKIDTKQVSKFDKSPAEIKIWFHCCNEPIIVYYESNMGILRMQFCNAHFKQDNINSLDLSDAFSHIEKDISKRDEDFLINNLLL